MAAVAILLVLLAIPVWTVPDGNRDMQGKWRRRESNPRKVPGRFAAEQDISSDDADPRPLVTARGRA